MAPTIPLPEGDRLESTRDVALYVRYLAVTSAIMLASCVLACIGPARRALAIHPSEALKEA